MDKKDRRHEGRGPTGVEPTQPDRFRTGAAADLPLGALPTDEALPALREASADAVVAPPAGRHSPSRIDTLPDAFAEMLRRKVGLAPGTVIGGKYALRAFIADGAMGQVFKAENLAINMPVALKLLKPELLANVDFRKRFQKEAEAIAAIVHPNVARFLDLVVGDPTFLVLEYVNGETLAAVLAHERQLAPERAVAIAIRLAWGLEAAHAAQVIHRDLKPGNIMLAPDREHGETPKIIDFGLAKLASQAEESALTRTGQIVGTPRYMAPEQIQSGTVDARTDVYALGCVLYEMIAGASQFSGADDDVQVLYRQLHEVPAPLSSRARSVPPELDQVVARALAKRPEDRFESMRALAEALGRAMQARARAQRETTLPSADRPSPRPAAGKNVGQPPAGRGRAVVGIGVLTALVFGLAGGIVLERRRDHRDAEAPAGGAPVTPAPGGELLVLVSSPPGANVILDGEAIAETTPTVVRGPLAGSHTVVFEKPGYQPLTRTVTVAEGQRVTVQGALGPQSRAVMVRTVPSGAKLFLDDVLVAASTPATVTLTLGEFHTLRAERDGFITLERHLMPEDRAPELALEMVEEHRPRGQLLVDSSVSAEVWIDGEDTGYATPTLPIWVAAGKHTVQLKDDSGVPGTPRQVTVERGATVRLTLDPPGTAACPDKPR